MNFDNVISLLIILAAVTEITPITFIFFNVNFLFFLFIIILGDLLGRLLVRSDREPYVKDSYVINILIYDMLIAPGMKWNDGSFMRGTLESLRFRAV